MAKPAFNLYEAAAGAPWLITETALERVLTIVEAHSKAPDWRPDLAALAKDLGRPLENTQETTIVHTAHGAVAMIPVRGPIFPHANSLHAISGATSTEALSSDFHAALNSSKVDAIAFLHDSPGGAVSGIAEFANEIRNREPRKPVFSFVEGESASADYWLAAAADSVFASPSARVGSIGVVITMSKADGRKYEMVSRQSPNKRPNPETESGRAQLVDEASDVAAVFIGAVAEYRGVSAATVEADFGQGGMLVAAKAKAAGMIDGVAHFADVLGKGMWVDKSPMVARPGILAAEPEKDNMDWKKLFGKGKDGESAADAEARMERLVSAMGDTRADFALAQFKAGHDVPQAIDALAAAHAAELKTVNEALAKAIAAIGEKDAQLKAATEAAAKDKATIAALESKAKDLEARPPTAKGMGSPGAPESGDKAIFDAMVRGGSMK